MLTSAADTVVSTNAAGRRLADRLALVVAVLFLAIPVGLVGATGYCWLSPGVVRLGHYGVLGPNARPPMRMRSNLLVLGQKRYSNVTLYLFPGGDYGRELYSVAGFRLLEMK